MSKDKNKAAGRADRYNIFWTFACLFFDHVVQYLCVSELTKSVVGNKSAQLQSLEGILTHHKNWSSDPNPGAPWLKVEVLQKTTLEIHS